MQHCSLPHLLMTLKTTQNPTNTATFSVTSVLHQIILAAVFAIHVRVPKATPALL